MYLAKLMNHKIKKNNGELDVELKSTSGFMPSRPFLEGTTLATGPLCR